MPACDEMLPLAVSVEPAGLVTVVSLQSTRGAEIVRVPLTTVIAENVPLAAAVLIARRFRGPVPPSVYEFALSKRSVPAKCSPSIVAVVGAVGTLPKTAVALPPSGAMMSHFALSDQLPEVVEVHVAC